MESQKGYVEGLDHPLFPPVPQDLVDALDKRFPLRNPGLLESERVIFSRVGQREIVDFLREQKRQQDESSLSNELAR